MAKPGYKRFDEWVRKRLAKGWTVSGLAHSLHISTRRVHQLRKPGCGVPRLAVLQHIEANAGIPAKAWLS